MIMAGGSSQLDAGGSAFGGGDTIKARSRERSGTGKSSKDGKKGFLSSFSGQSSFPSPPSSSSFDLVSAGELKELNQSMLIETES